VLDDEGVLAETLADVLRLQRHQVDVFTEPRAALAHLARASADLLFTDLGMPEMSGWDVAQEARRIHPQLPVVLVTGWGYQIDPAQVRECRVHALVSKPYRVQDIIRVVAEVLSARPTP
jgi:DNA-binding response OmpR family regulator